MIKFLISTTLLIFSLSVHAESSKQVQDLVNDIKKSGKLIGVDQPSIDLFETEADSCFDCVTRQVNAHPNNSVKGMCEVVVNSKTCQNIPKESRIDCNNWRQTSSTGKTIGCASGAGEGLKDILYFAWSIVKGTANVGNEIGKYVYESFDSEIRPERTKRHGEAIASAFLYLSNEYDKAGEIVPKIGGAITNFLKKEYKEFGCLNAEAKAQATCYTIFSIAGGFGGTYGTAKGTKAAWRKGRGGLQNRREQKEIAKKIAESRANNPKLNATMTDKIDELIQNDPNMTGIQIRLAERRAKQTGFNKLVEAEKRINAPPPAKPKAVPTNNELVGPSKPGATPAKPGRGGFRELVEKENNINKPGAKPKAVPTNNELVGPPKPGATPTGTNKTGVTLTRTGRSSQRRGNSWLQQRKENRLVNKWSKDTFDDAFGSDFSKLTPDQKLTRTKQWVQKFERELDGTSVGVSPKNRKIIDGKLEEFSAKNPALKNLMDEAKVENAKWNAWINGEKGAQRPRPPAPPAGRGAPPKPGVTPTNQPVGPPPKPGVTPTNQPVGPPPKPGVTPTNQPVGPPPKPGVTPTNQPVGPPSKPGVTPTNQPVGPPPKPGVTPTNQPVGPPPKPGVTPTNQPVGPSKPPTTTSTTGGASKTEATSSRATSNNSTATNTITGSKTGVTPTGTGRGGFRELVEKENNINNRPPRRSEAVEARFEAIGASKQRRRFGEHVRKEKDINTPAATPASTTKTTSRRPRVASKPPEQSTGIRARYDNIKTKLGAIAQQTPVVNRWFRTRTPKSTPITRAEAAFAKRWTQSTKKYFDGSNPKANANKRMEAWAENTLEDMRNSKVTRLSDRTVNKMRDLVGKTPEMKELLRKRGYKPGPKNIEKILHNYMEEAAKRKGINY